MDFNCRLSYQPVTNRKSMSKVENMQKGNVERLKALLGTPKDVKIKPKKKSKKVK